MSKTKSDVLRIAELEARTQLTSQVIGLVADPLWSTILGFVAIHELRKRNLIGPVADDILYAGVIAINTARTPALTDLAGKGLGTLATIGVGAASAAGTVGAGYVAKKGITAVASKGSGGAAVALLPVGIATALAAKELERKGYTVSRPGFGGTASAEQ
jgi:hypothetical protein